MENSNTHSRAVFGEDLNSVLSLFNQALKNEHDAGNRMHTTTNAFSHLVPQYLDTLILLKVIFQGARPRKQTCLELPIELFCKCRQPKYGLMVQCDKCNEWFHENCVNISTTLLMSNTVWHCLSCKN